MLTKKLNEAKKKLDKMKLPDTEQLSYKRYLENLHYQASMYNTYLAGEKKGRKEGIEEGIKEGIETGKLEIAKNLLNLGISINDISIATGLGTEEIEKIAKKS